jgi:hypothetical protein
MEKEKEIEECCGNCCWFFSEDTDGWGFCAANKGTVGDFVNCSDLCLDEYVSRQEMRHHMAVLLQLYRCETEEGKNGWDSEKKCWKPIVYRKLPTMKHALNAMMFAYKYMKIFSQL